METMSAVDVRSADALLTEVIGSGATRSRFAISIRERRAILAIADFLAGAVGCVLAYAIVRPVVMPMIPLTDIGLYGVAWVIGLFIVNGYAFSIPSSRAQSAIAVIKATPFAGLAGVVAFFIEPYLMTRPLIVTSTLVGAVLLIVMRTTVARLLLHESLSVRAVLIGRSEPNRLTLQTLEAAKGECRIVARIIGPTDTEASRDNMIEAVRKLFSSQLA